MSEVKEGKVFSHIPALHYLLNLTHKACTQAKNKEFVEEEADDSKQHKIVKLLDALEHKMADDGILKSAGAESLATILMTVKDLIRTPAFKGFYILDEEEIDSAVLYMLLDKNTGEFKHLLFTAILEAIKTYIQKETNDMEELVEYLRTTNGGIDLIIKTCEERTNIVNGRMVEIQEVIKDKVANKPIDPYLDKILTNALIMRTNKNQGVKNEFVELFS